jgi:Transposase, Mutator family
VLAALPKSAHPAAKKALAEIYNAENKAAALKAAHTFATEYGAKWPKAVAKIVDDLDVLTAFYDFPAEHWIHLRTANPIESTFATVRLRTRVTKGPGSRATGVAMAFKRIESAQAHWRAVNAPHLVFLGRAGAKFENGKLVERPDEQEVISKPRDQGGHETGRHVGRNFRARFGCLTGWGAWTDSDMQGGPVDELLDVAVATTSTASPLRGSRSASRGVLRVSSTPPLSAGSSSGCSLGHSPRTPYQAMPLGDVGKVLEEAHRFCAGRGMEFGAYPMQELATHPHAAGLLRLFADHVGGAEFEPLATTGSHWPAHPGHPRPGPGRGHHQRLHPGAP